jgi:hypothetical protein
VEWRELEGVSDKTLTVLSRCVTTQVPSEIAGKKVEEIVKDWNTELEQRSQQFARHAQVRRCKSCES